MVTTTNTLYMQSVCLYFFRSLVIAIVLSVSAIAAAQQHVVTTSTTERSQLVSGPSRDFWFAMVENYELQGGGAGKYYEMYVVPKVSTTINIALGNAAGQQFEAQQNKVLVFRLPLAWEMTQSGVIQEAVHVWSDNSDLNVQALSRNAATSDGMTVVPVIAWGNEYIVAAYHSFAFLSGYDLSSEFAVVASQNETVVTITPTTDLRQGQESNITYPRGVTFTVTLQRGEAVQYQASNANGNQEGYDVTGTKISSNKPVGVVAGVQCANVPVEAQYCDHICEMLLPIDHWGTTYHTVPFADRVGGDGFVVIAAFDNTTIHREDAQGKRVHAVLDKFEPFYRHDIDLATKWSSDKPFMLAQYINGANWPETGANNGIGDPSMTIITPQERYTTELVIQTPSITSSEFKNYLNIVAPKGAAVSLDGKPVQVSSIKIDDQFVAYRVKDITKGSHTITSDSAIGTYVYGYGAFDSYAWPGSLGSFDKPVVDTTAAVITSLFQECFGAHVRVADAPQNPSAQLTIIVESEINMRVDGIGYGGTSKDSGSYNLLVLDSSKPASAKVVVTDNAKNRRIIAHSYEPNIPQFDAATLVFDVAWDSVISLSFDLNNTTERSTGSLAFWLSQGADMNIIDAPQKIDAKTNELIQLKYRPDVGSKGIDTIIVSDGCWTLSTPIVIRTNGYIASGTEVDFGTVQIDSERVKTFTLTNRGSEVLIVNSIMLSGSSVFSVKSSAVPPIVLQGGEHLNVDLAFHPVVEGSFEGDLDLVTSLGSIRADLIGVGSLTASVDERELPLGQLNIAPNPASSSINLKLDLLEAVPTVLVTIRDLNGRTVCSQTLQSVGFWAEADMNILDLPNGNYFVEVTSDGRRVKKKLTIER